jgi:transcriptional regulator GlxA family with amidase domain
VSALRPELAKLVEDLLAGTAEGDSITLDAIGEAIGARAIAQDEIDAMLSAIEEQGRHVLSAESGRGEVHLKSVLDAARSLRVELGRPPRIEEIAGRAGISRAEVQHALSLARIMQR